MQTAAFSQISRLVACFVMFGGIIAAGQLGHSLNVSSPAAQAPSVAVYVPKVTYQQVTERLNAHPDANIVVAARAEDGVRKAIP